jgi:hypothetical protein
LAAAARIGFIHAVAIALGLTLVWFLSVCRASTDACDVGGGAFLALFAAGAATATMLLTVPAVRRRVFARFEGATRAIWLYLILTVGLRFLFFVIPPLWVIGLIDVAIVDALLPHAHGAVFVTVVALAHGVGAAAFVLISLRRGIPGKT